MKKFFCTILLTISLAIPSSAIKKMYLGGFGLLTSAQNIGYQKDAIGGEIDFLLISNRIGLSSNFCYSTSKKVKTNSGYSLGAQVEGFCRMKKKLFLASGLRYRYYTACLWEKKANMFFVGVKYGLPDDLLSVTLTHYFKEHQTNSECSITSIKLSGMIFRNKRIGLQIRSQAHLLRYNFKMMRKTGVSGDIGIGIFFNLK